ncbi:hypothetical protein [Bacillus bingmayongensis]|uniref:hypothetical protein n=1 Tax=Bacillus bingmayongensis TaxID=1150157 RepID=UPI001C8DC509|nr:hypothetical protein [Bacillus bingmayongensis]MBY0598761.1 hypothetical protein [Bacillus bingmayongensis]
MGKIQGHVGLDILENSERLVERFESAFSSTVKTYIESTPINVTDVEFLIKEDKIDILYSFDNLVFHYKHENGEVTSIAHEAEFGRALFEFWTKCVVQTFFEKELQVKTKYTELSFLNIMTMKEMTI